MPLSLLAAVPPAAARAAADADRAAFLMPPVTATADGRPRRVGVEIEFGRLSARAAAGALADALGGRIEREDAHAFCLRGSELGDLRVEADMRLLHPARHRGTPRGRLPTSVAAVLGHLAAPWVPRELVLPPLPLDRLAETDRAVEALARAGARPNRTASFGLHFNVDPPRADAATALAYLRAFLTLSAPLRATAGPAGRFDPRPDFPDAYRALVLDPAYAPDGARLVDDYVAMNPTRRRDLDLLPLLLTLDAARVRAALPDEKITARPVLHYRLPAARVGVPGWSVAEAWNDWVTVERLVAGG